MAQLEMALGLFEIGHFSVATMSLELSDGGGVQAAEDGSRIWFRQWQ